MTETSSVCGRPGMIAHCSDPRCCHVAVQSEHEASWNREWTQMRTELDVQTGQRSMNPSSASTPGGQASTAHATGWSRVRAANLSSLRSPAEVRKPALGQLGTGWGCVGLRPLCRY